MPDWHLVQGASRFQRGKLIGAMGFADQVVRSRQALQLQARQLLQQRVANTSPVIIRLCGRLKHNNRALPLALPSSSGCCKTTTSTPCVIGLIHWQIQVLCGRMQVA